MDQALAGDRRSARPRVRTVGGEPIAPRGFELIDGDPVRRKAMGFESSWVATQLLTLLAKHCEAVKWGVAVSADGCSLR